MCWYPTFRKVLLQPRHLGQAACVEDGSAHALLLFVGVDALFARVGTVRVRGDDEALGLVARDLGELVRRNLETVVVRTWFASSVGSSTVPNSSLAFFRSISRTLLKSRKRTVGQRQMTQYR